MCFLISLESDRVEDIDLYDALAGWSVSNSPATGSFSAEADADLAPFGQPFQSIVPIVNSVIGRKEKPMTHGFRSKDVDYNGFSRFFGKTQHRLDKCNFDFWIQSVTRVKRMRVANSFFMLCYFAG